ncbi:MAG: O-acetyl-ADP-ribose deacetylase [Candidatus Parcubacteria bacterium]|nr:MAG: O-acetyl-ADP-ribose deacetylase [Candidatus Parcubacteria bacterium]
MLKQIKGDITEIEVDAIINAANTELIHGGGISLAIAKKAGEKLVEESKNIGFVPIGEFSVTTAGNLKATKVIHIPTIDYKNNKKITYEELENVLEKVFRYCEENNYKTIATPLLGTGVVGLDKEKVRELIKNKGEKFTNLEIIIVEK